ncbi:MAG: hypothetical protein ISS71_06000 [Phycisphaerae bacterium]|nr:hypothetical protein [Phycisphaerae bacterium]
MAEKMTLTELAAHPTIKDTIKRFALRLMRDQDLRNVEYDPDHDEFAQMVPGDIFDIAHGKGWKNDDEPNNPIIEHENPIAWGYKVIENLYKQYRKCIFTRGKYPVYDGSKVVELRSFESVHDLLEEEIPRKEQKFVPSGVMYVQELRDFLKLQGMDVLATEIAVLIYRGYKRSDVARELGIKVNEYENAKKRLQKDWLRDFIKELEKKRRDIEEKLF